MQATTTVIEKRTNSAPRLLENRRALVTGASAGIGADFARQLAALGCHLVLVARTENRLRELAAEITRDHGVGVEVIAEDLSDPQAPARLFGRVTAAGLDVDILVNNAGIGMYGDFAAQDLGRIKEMLQLNVMSLTDLTHLFLPQMRARKFGRIIQVGSIASFMAGPGYGAYSASKMYVLGLGQSLNEELRGTGVSCTVVCPGMTKTNFFDVAGHKESSMYMRMVMMRSRDVARIGIAGALKGKSRVVTGLINRAQIFAQHFIPNRIMYHVARMIMELGEKKKPA